jgi:hypothetical protein
MTKNVRFLRWLPLALLLPISAMARTAQADEADDLFAKGLKAFDAGQMEEAEAHYEAAFKLRKSPDIAGNLAQTELALKKRTEAAGHLEYTLQVLPTTTKPEVRQAVEAKMAELRAALAAVVIETNVEGATVAVDGVDVGNTPLPGAVWLEPGSRKILATHKDHEPAEQAFAALAGQVQRTRLELVPKEGATTGPTPEAKPVWPFVVLGSLAAAGLGVGIGGIVLEQQQLSDADDALAGIGVGACGPAGDSCAAVNDSLSQANKFQAMGIAGFTIAGAAGVGALIYGLVPSSAPASGKPVGQSVRVMPLLGPVSGAFLEGKF